ncbi:hypothetical protein AB5J62_33370 [Amycolatopsis sp. cg5]|uniref:hypothetical protein n=1 Tax=Amycolatopsis sp. cg5 TaxID=3238802 RepID=UPI003523DA85
MPEQQQNTSESTEKRGKGRPAIGGPIRQEIGDDLKACVETWALGHGTNRAAAVRTLLRRALDQELEPMSRTVVVDGDDLSVLLGEFRGDDIRRVRFAFDSGLKVKVNDGQWTLPVGTLHDSVPPQEKE